MLIGRIWFQGFQALSTILGFLSAGIAITLKDLIANIAGWFFLVFQRPFDVGDRIQIGSFKGDVVDLKLFQCTLMEISDSTCTDQYTERLIHVPNSKIFSKPLL